MRFLFRRRIGIVLAALLTASAFLAIFIDWDGSTRRNDIKPPPLLSQSSTVEDRTSLTSPEILREQKGPEALDPKAATERERNEATPPADSSIPDPRPHAYSPAHILITVESDRWLNPEKLKFTEEEKRKIQEFADAAGPAIQNLESSFHQRLNELGTRLIEQGKYDGRVNERELSDEERNKLPHLTEDWLNPVFVSWSGGFRTWVKIDLRKEDPALADLRLDGWAAQAAARARLRDYIAELARKR
jgi:hypothetical protein